MRHRVTSKQAHSDNMDQSYQSRPIPRTRGRGILATLYTLACLALVACGSSGGQTAATRTPSAPPSGSATPLRVTEVAKGLDTVWALAWDPQGRLWYTQRSGQLAQVNGSSSSIAGVMERGEGGLMGLEIDGSGRKFLMYTAGDENRVVRLESDGKQTTLVSGIQAGGIHNGGRIRLGPDGMLYVGTGDAGNGDSARPDAGGLNGRILRVNPDSGATEVLSAGHRNPQGLCFAPDGKLYSAEHGPDRGDEINIITKGENGGWPETTGNGIHNYTPTIAPAGCVIYNAALIPQWRGSLLFVTLKDTSLRRLTLGSDGKVAGEEILYRGEYGRLRDVAVGPDGAVYLATSNRDGRGSPQEGDDRILRIGPA